MPSYQVKHIRIKRCNSFFIFFITEKPAFLKILQDQYYSQVLELGNTFISSVKDMTYEHYLEKPTSMCEIKLNKILAKDPNVMNCLYRITSHLLIRKYSHILVGEN